MAAKAFRRNSSSYEEKLAYHQWVFSLTAPPTSQDEHASATQVAADRSLLGWLSNY
jgi:hypothetical protein